IQTETIVDRKIWMVYINTPKVEFVFGLLILLRERNFLTSPEPRRPNKSIRAITMWNLIFRRQLLAVWPVVLSLLILTFHSQANIPQMERPSVSSFTDLTNNWDVLSDVRQGGSYLEQFNRFHEGAEKGDANAQYKLALM